MREKVETTEVTHLIESLLKAKNYCELNKFTALSTELECIDENCLSAREVEIMMPEVTKGQVEYKKVRIPLLSIFPISMFSLESISLEIDMYITRKNKSTPQKLTFSRQSGLFKKNLPCSLKLAINRNGELNSSVTLPD